MEQWQVGEGEPPPGVDDDPRVVALRGAVARLRRELASYPVELPDRMAAEEELAALAAMVAEGAPDAPRLHAALLLVTGALGSISALAPALGEVRDGIGRFGGLPGIAPPDVPPGPWR